MKKSNVTLRGIVVAGDSRQEAENHYRAVATGLSVKALQDSEANFVILSNADSELSLMNPLSGDMNLVEASDLNTDDFEFLASGEDETVNVFYTLCSDGCGSHIIADDSDLMQRCPVCASDLQDLSAEDIAGIEAEMNAEASDEEEEDQSAEASDDSEEQEEVSAPSMITVASSKAEAIEAFRALAEGETAPSAFDCETGIVVTASGTDFEYSPFTGEAAVDAGEIEGFNVEASADGNLEAHYYVCASDECGSHVVSSSEDPVFCPVCSSGLIEPEVLASDDDEDEDLLDDEDDELDDESVFDEEEDEDDEALAGSDDDDDDEEDEEDEDDSDDEEEDLDDDDEDFDDKNSLSVSSVTVEDDEPAPVALESVSTNLLALASAEAGELKHDQLEVAFAGNVAGTPTWLATYAGKIVATATPETASSVESNVFNSDVFSKLVHASAAENGVSAALSELGFRPIEASVNVDAYIQEEVASRVEAGVSSVRSNFEQSSSDYAARFEAALATAATGVNKNFFEDVKNPIKAALASTMSSLGIQNADRLVAQAFAQHNDTYLKGLVAKACEIMEYDVEVQNQLTKAVASTANEQTVTASGSGESLSIGRPVETQQRQQPVERQQEATASASEKPKVNLDAALSTLGRRGRY